MDPFHQRLARVALAAVSGFGFALAGGYAVQVHGFLTRQSSDVDLFAPSEALQEFAHAIDAVVAAYQSEALVVEVELRSDSFARLAVRADGRSAKVELGIDWRANEPVRLEIGPVLHPDDAVANKVCALFGRAEVRDFVDVDAILASLRYTEDELLSLAEDHDPGFDRLWFARALTAIHRFPDSLFSEYALAPSQVAAMKERMTGWAARIRDVAGT